MSTTSVTYTGNGSTTVFSVPFPFLRVTDLQVFVNGVSASFSIAGSDVIVSPAPSGTVLIQRITDISTRVVTFTNSSALLATSLNNAHDQLRLRMQELEAALEAGGISPGGAGTNVPNPGATNQFIVSEPSGSGWEWRLKSVSQVQTILGINTGGANDSRLPAPNVANTVLMVNGAGNAYQLSTLATLKTLLEIPSLSNQLPTVNGRSYHFVYSTDENTYELASIPETRTALGLGTAAQLNAGTSVGNVVTLVSSAAGPALPAVSGVNLLGVAKEPAYSRWDKTSASIAFNAGSMAWANLSSSMTAVKSASFASIGGSGGNTAVRVLTGKYQITVEAVTENSVAGQPTNCPIPRIRTIVVDAASTTLLDLESLRTNGPAASATADTTQRTIFGYFEVTTAHADIYIDGKMPGSTTSRLLELGLRLHIVKIA
jgi:hypothetical protein